MNKTLAEIRAMAQAAQDRSAFIHVARSLAVAKGRPHDALAFAQEQRLPQAAVNVLKAAVAGGSLSNLPELAGSSTVVTSFMETLAGSSAFALAVSQGWLHRAPFHTRIIAAANVLQANEFTQGAAIRVRALDLVAKQIAPRGVGAITVASDELWESSDPRGVAYVERLLREAIGSAVDKAVFATLDDGNDFTAVVDDLATFKIAFRAALSSIHKRPGHRIAVACSVDAANDLTALDENGRIDPLGGSIFGLPCVVTTGVDTGLKLVDWASVIGEVTRIEMVATNSGSLQMDDNPSGSSVTPTASNLVSMFQTNTTAIKCGTWFAAEKSRADVLASIELEIS